MSKTYSELPQIYIDWYGMLLTAEDGDTVGLFEGDDVGLADGEFVGILLGLIVGLDVGFAEGESVGDELGEIVGFSVTGDKLGEFVGSGVGSSVARFINVQAFPVIPSKHFASPVPSLFPSTTMYSVVSTVPVQSRHLITEYEPLLFTEVSILPAQALVRELELVTFTPTRPGM